MTRAKLRAMRRVFRIPIFQRGMCRRFNTKRGTKKPMGIIKMKNRIRILNIVLKINFILKVYHKGFLYQDVRIPSP
jgi:hypothetical protein